MLNRLRGLQSSWMEDRDHTKETELISVGSLIFQAVSLDEKKQIQNKKESPRANKCRIRKKLKTARLYSLPLPGCPGTNFQYQSSPNANSSTVNIQILYHKSHFQKNILQF